MPLPPFATNATATVELPRRNVVVFATTELPTETTAAFAVPVVQMPVELA